MKMKWLLFVFVLFLVAAPAAKADDGSVADLIGKVIAMIIGDQPELGSEYPPNGNTILGDQEELGDEYPPSG